MTTAEIYNNNHVNLDGKLIGKVNRTTTPNSKGQAVEFFPVRIDRTQAIPFVWGGGVKITSPVYIGGPADWTINPDFIHEAEAAYNAFSA